MITYIIARKKMNLNPDTSLELSLDAISGSLFFLFSFQFPRLEREILYSILEGE